jgi:hypothetical protein
MATPTTLPASFTAGQVLTAAQQNALRGAFRVLQVVSTTKVDTFTTSSTTFTDITGLDVTITPSSASSQILVFAQINASNDTTIAWLQLNLVRGSTAIDVGTAVGSRTATSAQVDYFSGGGGAVITTPLIFLDSPATTSATTYKIQGRNTSAGTSYVNRSKGDTDAATQGRFASTITVLEISA